jgi:hypothetical protein
VSRKTEYLCLFALLIVQCAVIVSRAHGSAMFVDDFLNFEIYREAGGFRLHYLLRDVFGQVAPGFRLTQGLFFEVFGVSYAAALAVMTSLSLASTALIYGITRRLNCAGWAIWSGVIVFVFLPQFTAVQLWWSAAVHTLFSLTAILCAALCIVGKNGNGPSKRGLLLTIAWFALALLFTAKAVFSIVFLTALLTYAYRTRPTGELARLSVRNSIPLIVLVALYFLAIMRVSPTPAGADRSHDLQAILKFAWFSIGDSTVAAMFGLGLHGIPMPETLAIVLSCAAVLLIALLGVWNNPRSSVVWVGVVGYVLVSSLVIALERAAAFADGAYKMRYGVESTTFIVVGVIIALSGVRLHAKGKCIGIAIAVALACNLQINSSRIELEAGTLDGKAYASNLRHSLEQLNSVSGVVILDGDAPPAVMPEWMEHYRRLSMLVPLFTTKYPITDDSRATWRVRDDGQIVPITK